MAEEQTKITRADIEHVSQKLESAMENMTEQERNVLGLILTRAAAAEEPDVEGFAFFGPQAGFANPFAGQLAHATGFSPAAKGTITVSWGYHHST